MGCTSSAPSTLDPKPSSASERKLVLETVNIEHDVKTVNVKESKEFQSSIDTLDQVLPASDIIETNIDLDSSIESPVSESKPDEVEEVSNGTQIKQISSVPNLLKEELIEQKHISENPSEAIVIEDFEESCGDIEDKEPIVDTGQMTPTGIMKTTEETEKEEESNESPKYMAINRRATRWEALADVVAELPPKVTLDPMTGQIYSLSKRD